MLDKRKGVFPFVPGQNHIDPAIWKAVMAEAGEKRLKHFSAFLKPIGDAATEKGANIAALSADDAIDLVRGAMDFELLAEYAKAEKKR